MFLSKITMLAALALMPAPALAQAAPEPAKLVDLQRWNEVVLPGAPFRIDMPMPFKSETEKVIGDTKEKTWKTAYGFMNVEISFSDRDRDSTFSVRKYLELLAGGLLEKWKNATAEVTDLTVLGYPAAKLVMENDVDSGRIRTERLLFRVGQDDWAIQTSRFLTDGELDSAHIFRSIQAPSPAPVLTPASVGRMNIKGFGKPIVTVDKLEGDASATYDKWVTYAFDHQGSIKAWIYNIQVKPGNAFDVQAIGQMLVDSVVQQSKGKPQFYSFAQRIGGLEGVDGRGQAVTGEGEEAFRIFSVGDGPEGWAMLAAGPNDARTETVLREMMGSITFQP